MATVRSHAKSHGFQFPVLKDSGGAVAGKYGAGKTPEVFVFDRHMKLRYHGAIDNSPDAGKVASGKQYVRKAIRAVLAGQSPSPAETAAFGCGISRG